MIFANYQNMSLRESLILQLHDEMLNHSDKDSRHKGSYKLGSNRVEAKDHSGKVVGIIFDPTPPHLVKKEMRELIDWFNWTTSTKAKHPLI